MGHQTHCFMATPHPQYSVSTDNLRPPYFSGDYNHQYVAKVFDLMKVT